MTTQRTRIKGITVQLTPQEIEGCLTRLRDVLTKGYLIWGEYQEKLQAQFEQETGKAHAVTFNSATSAYDALFEVIRPRRVAFQGNMFPSPLYAARRHGAEVVWLDIDPVAMVPTMEQLEAATPFDCLVLDASGGYPPPWLPDMAKWCQEKGIVFIEDCAQSAGAKVGGMLSGSFGEFTIFSLAATKPLMAGQGGVLCTNDGVVAKRAFHLKNYGRTLLFQRGDYLEEGHNQMMTELQAAVGVTMFETYRGHIAERAVLADGYALGLAGLRVQLCGQAPGVEPNWYKYPILLRGITPRSVVKKRLAEVGIECGSEIYSVPTPQQMVFRREFGAVRLPGTEVFSANHICLPMHNALSTEDVAEVAAALAGAMA